MQSTKSPFSRSERCPSTDKIVVVSGVLLSLVGAPEFARKNCTDADQCLQAHGSLDKIQGCILSNLRA